jgi:hypothetical protein
MEKRLSEVLRWDRRLPVMWNSRSRLTSAIKYVSSAANIFEITVRGQGSTTVRVS